MTPEVIKAEARDLNKKATLLFAQYEVRIQNLGKQPFIFGRAAWQAKKEAILAEFYATPEAKRIAELRQICAHEWGPKEQLDWGPFDQQTCVICGKIKRWMIMD